MNFPGIRHKEPHWTGPTSSARPFHAPQFQGDAPASPPSDVQFKDITRLTQRFLTKKWKQGKHWLEKKQLSAPTAGAAAGVATFAVVEGLTGFTTGGTLGAIAATAVTTQKVAKRRQAHSPTQVDTPPRHTTPTLRDPDSGRPDSP